jgi:predicted CoA-binding protein
MTTFQSGVTIVLGASDNPSRASNTAASMLERAGVPWIPIGIKNATIYGKTILPIQTQPHIDHIDTITLYLGPSNQKDYYEYILSLKPRRIIFNPGTENPELAQKAKENNIESEFACTLVLLSTGQY